MGHLFLIAYLPDEGVLLSSGDFLSWARDKQYSVPLKEHIDRLLSSSNSSKKHQDGLLAPNPSCNQVVNLDVSFVGLQSRIGSLIWTFAMQD
jgi:hypothetical protein